MLKNRKFLKKELTPEAWSFYKSDMANGDKFQVNEFGEFFYTFAGENHSFFVGSTLEDVIAFILWR